MFSFYVVSLLMFHLRGNNKEIWLFDEVEEGGFSGFYVEVNWQREKRKFVCLFFIIIIYILLLCSLSWASEVYAKKINANINDEFL